MPSSTIVQNDTIHDGANAKSQKLSLVREFNASREQVWRAWTQPEAIVQWLGPRHCPAIEVHADVQEGGAWRACLKADGKEPLWQSGRYLVISPPERLEFTFAWEGSNHEDGPGVQTHVVVLLDALPDGRTRMRFAQTGLASVKSVAGHTDGWQSTFDRLEGHLSLANF